MENLYSLVSLDVDSQNSLFLNTHWFVLGKKNFKDKWFEYKFKPLWVEYNVREHTPKGEFVREHNLKEFLEKD